MLHHVMEKVHAPVSVSAFVAANTAQVWAVLRARRAPLVHVNVSVVSVASAASSQSWTVPLQLTANQPAPVVPVPLTFNVSEYVLVTSVDGGPETVHLLALPRQLALPSPRPAVTAHTVAVTPSGVQVAVTNPSRSVAAWYVTVTTTYLGHFDHNVFHLAPLQSRTIVFAPAPAVPQPDTPENFDHTLHIAAL